MNTPVCRKLAVKVTFQRQLTATKPLGVDNYLIYCVILTGGVKSNELMVSG
jgi:hypothetical protein